MTEQPLPQRSSRSEPVTSRLIQLLKNREAKGIATYGQSLTTFNGRSALVDALEEALDLAQYLTQMVMERDAIPRYDEMQNGCDACQKMAAKWKAELEELRAQQNDPPSCASERGVAGSVEPIVPNDDADQPLEDLWALVNDNIKRLAAIESAMHSKPEPQGNVMPRCEVERCFHYPVWGGKFPEPSVPVSELREVLKRWYPGAKTTLPDEVRAAIAKAEGGAE